MSYPLLDMLQCPCVIKVTDIPLTALLSFSSLFQKKKIGIIFFNELFTINGT